MFKPDGSCWARSSSLSSFSISIYVSAEIFVENRNSPKKQLKWLQFPQRKIAIFIVEDYLSNYFVSQ